MCPEKPISLILTLNHVGWKRAVLQAISKQYQIVYISFFQRIVNTKIVGFFSFLTVETHFL